jgi:hypothetical protein
MSDNTPRRSRKPHLDADRTAVSSDGDDPTSGQRAEQGSSARDFQAKEGAASDGQPNSPAPDVADAAKPKADPFDLLSLRLSQDFSSAVGVRKLLKTVPVKKPSKEWFIRTHPKLDYRFPTAVLELKEDRETYLVSQDLWPLLADEKTFSPRELVTAITRQGNLFLWPIRLPGADGRIDDWSRSALAAADEAKSQWVRITANMGLGAYDVAVASGSLAEPDWPDLKFNEIIKIAFRDKMISEWNHPVLRRLRGEV